MQISIASRFRPYSQLPGSSTLIPGSALRVEAYPALLRFYDMEEQLLAELPLAVRGPVAGFALQLDLEQGLVWIWGHGQDGYFRLSIQSEAGQLRISSKKGLPELDAWTLSHASCQEPEEVSERLSLGCHRKQDIDRLWRQREFRLLLPLALRLSQLLPTQEALAFPWTGVMAPLEGSLQSPDTSIEGFDAFFRAAFSSLLLPRLSDVQHQGLTDSTPCTASSPLQLLTEAARLIQSLFIQENEQGLSILPCLPPLFHCGRYVGLQLAAGNLDLEWSKKRIRRMALRAKKTGELPLRFPSGTRSFRLRRSMQELGCRCDAGTPLRVEEGQVYYLDRFER